MALEKTSRSIQRALKHWHSLDVQRWPLLLDLHYAMSLNRHFIKDKIKIIQFLDTLINYAKPSFSYEAQSSRGKDLLCSNLSDRKWPWFGSLLYHQLGFSKKVSSVIIKGFRLYACYSLYIIISIRNLQAVFHERFQLTVKRVVHFEYWDLPICKSDIINGSCHGEISVAIITDYWVKSKNTIWLIFDSWYQASHFLNIIIVLQ